MSRLPEVPIEDLHLSVRSYGALRRGGIATVGELISKTEEDLLLIRNIGSKSLEDIKDNLLYLGLALTPSPRPNRRDAPRRKRQTHGQKVALRGCDCRDCLIWLLRAWSWRNRYVNGETYEQIGHDVGLTRERVRQVIKAVDPDAFTRKWLRTLAPAPPVRFCAICATAFVTNHKTCGGDCSKMYSALRYHADEDRHDRHRTYTSRWAVNNPDKVPGFQLRLAKRRLSGIDPDYETGSWPSGRDRHWLIEGSDTWHAALYAFRRGGWIFDQLPEPIQKQIRNHESQVAAAA